MYTCTNIETHQVDAYPAYAASALAANTFVRCSFAGKPRLDELSPPIHVIKAVA